MKKDLNIKELYTIIDDLFYNIANEFDYQEEIEPYLKELREYMYKNINA